MNIEFFAKVQIAYDNRDLEALDKLAKPTFRVINKKNDFRSSLMLSCNNLKHLSKISSLDADSIMLNLEDGVSKENKPFALVLCAIILTQHKQSNKKLVVRVNALDEGVVVPTQFVNDGQIVLNISPSAVNALDLGNDWICFNARFGGKSLDIGLPPNAVLGIYARENGQGMLFQEEQPESDPPQTPDPESSSKISSRPKLKIIK